MPWSDRYQAPILVADVSDVVDAVCGREDFQSAVGKGMSVNARNSLLHWAVQNGESGGKIAGGG